MAGNTPTGTVIGQPVRQNISTGAPIGQLAPVELLNIRRLNMAPVAEKLIALARSVEPAGGFGGYYDLVDSLRANPEVLGQFKATLASARFEELDTIDTLAPNFAWIVMGAADAMDLLPDDPRLFLSASAADALSDNEVLGALCSACIVNDKQTVARLAKRIDVNSLDHNDQAPLCYAAGNNHGECVRILLAHGADPNRVQNWGNTALHVAASSVCSEETFEMLLEAGGDLSAVNGEGESVLQVLSKFDRQGWANRRTKRST